MEINGLTKTCGLLGNPVEHTLSPVIHNTLAELTGINLTYLPFLVEKEQLKEAVLGARALHILGLNVTVPYKEKILPYLYEVDELAEKIGAVNTLVSAENGYKGCNTDMPGLYRAMASDGISVEGEEILLLGAGGVARAVAVMLCDKVKRLIIINRTVEKAAAIAEEVNGYAGCKVAEALALTQYAALPGKDYLAIQATNIGMYPHTDETLISDTAFYEKIRIGYDLIYNPGETRFMKQVKAAGGEAYNGLKMLLYQGIIAFELWNNCKITKEQAAVVYKKLQDEL